MSKKRRAKRPPGRRTLLTKERFTAIVAEVEKTGDLSNSALAHGIAKQTAHEWIRRGEGIDGRPADPRFAAFAAAVTRARAVASNRLVNRVEQIGEGGAVIRRRTTIKKNGEEVVEEEFTTPDWRAHSWKASCVDRDQWGNHSKQTVEGTINIKLAASVVQVTLEVLTEYVPAEHLEAAAARLGQALDKAMGTSIVAIPGALALPAPVERAA